MSILDQIATERRRVADLLDLRHEVEPSAVRPALDLAVSKKAGLVSPTEHRRDIRFETDDQEWAWGSGDTVRGSSTSILITLLGRGAGVESLTGPGTETVRSRLS